MYADGGWIIMIIQKTTKDYIADSLFELMQTKSINNITVKEIVNNCQLTSTTFYHHFQDKYDLLSWTYKTLVNRYLQKIGDTYDWYHAARDSLIYIKEHFVVFKNAFVNTHGQDSFRTASFEIHFQESLKIIQSKNPDFEKNPMNMIKLKHYFYGVMGLSVEIIFGNKNFDPIQTTKQIIECMPEEIKMYLLHTDDWKL